MTLRVACIGKNGQTARALAAAADGSFELIQAGAAEADLRDDRSLAAFVERAKPDVLINAGAYNFVDKAETEEALAMAVNASGPLALALLCRTRGIAFIHMSTDCVFDGSGDQPHMEEETQTPMSAYGRSKAAGEIAVATEYPDALTVRVAWVFSEYGDNFVSKMIELARTRPKLRVVNDQIGPPTYAPDIARSLIRIAREKARGAQLSGLLHVVSSDVMDRASMARQIMAESRAQGGPFAEIEGVTTAEFNAPAMRPLNARLSNEKAVKLLGLTFTPWEQALKRSVAGILAR
ncbi:MAG TPA: dTDP-4-dehydrorhamnose reductase [Hyphomonadaceae bacterium]|nr:dTDP-4-dehydrorhamnose reductase [Hyphomonadaceae bacterium]